jgi:uncharacterized membrane protein
VFATDFADMIEVQRVLELARPEVVLVRYLRIPIISFHIVFWLTGSLMGFQVYRHYKKKFVRDVFYKLARVFANTAFMVLLVPLLVSSVVPL